MCRRSLEDLPDLLKVLVAVQLVALRAEVLHGTAKGLWGRKKRVSVGRDLWSQVLKETKSSAPLAME